MTSASTADPTDPSPPPITRGVGAAPAGPADDHLQCMEVVGGNEAVDLAIRMAGIDARIASRPCDGSEAGGDVHYLSSCATGRITRWLLADVSGHGAAAAGTSDRLRQLMRRHINRRDQQRFMGELNTAFTDGSDDEGGFATAVAASFYAPTSMLTLCNAGHPPPLLRIAARGAWTPLTTASAAPDGGRTPGRLMNVPFGVDQVTLYDQLEIRLAPGDVVLCYTDAVIESRDADGEMLGVEGLLDLVRAVDEDEPAAIVDGLMTILRARTTEGLGEDDLTVMAMRATDGPRTAPLTGRIRGLARMMGDLVSAPFRRGGPLFPEISHRTVGSAGGR